MMLIELDKAIRAVCPIDGISSDGVIHFTENATAAQRKAAQKIMDKEILTLGEKSAQEIIIDDISALELTITARRLREATLGTDNGWLANIDTQIAALRAQL